MLGQPSLLFKVVMVGDQNTGKSSLLSRVTRDDFDLQNHSTVGVQYSDRDLLSKDGILLRLQIWDPVSGERFARIQSPYFRCAVAVLLVFDVCRRQTFQLLDKLMVESKEYVPESSVYIVVANKCDLCRLRVVTYQQIENFAEMRGLSFVETSALTGAGCDQLLLRLGQNIYQLAELAELGLKTKLSVARTTHARAHASWC